jgi:positive regulator of sigma E activity
MIAWLNLVVIVVARLIKNKPKSLSIECEKQEGCEKCPWKYSCYGDELKVLEGEDEK